MLNVNLKEPLHCFVIQQSQYEFIYNALVVKSTMGDTLFKKDEYLDHYRTTQNDPKYNNQLMNQFEVELIIF